MPTIRSPTVDEQQAQLEEARALHRAGNAAAAEPIYRRIIETDPANPEAHHLLAVLALQRGAADDALALVERAIAVDGSAARYRNTEGNAHMALGAVAAAEDSFRRASELDATFAGARFNLGCALQALGRRAAAREAYEQAVALDPTYFDALNNLAGLLQGERDVARAVELYRRALAIRPDSPEAGANLAVALERMNETAEARRVAERVLSGAPDHAVANLVTATLDRRAGRCEQARARLERLLGAPRPALLAANAEMELGQCCDRLGSTDAAFAAFSRGNALRAGLDDAKAYDPERFLDAVHRNRSWFSRARVREWPAVQEEKGPDPVFFVGFPRSGTTLMEEMLRAHPSLVTTEERSPLVRVRGEIGVAYPEGLDALSTAGVAAARALYWDEARATLGAALDGQRLIDKLPLNLVELGLVARLFPRAPVIVALRDPRDVVLSCFMQQFRPNDAMASFFTLAGVTRLYAAVMDLWLHYREALELRYLEYRYEDLVAAPEQTMRRVIEFIGEPWSAAVRHYRGASVERYVATPSRQAVTEALTARAVGRWRGYRRHLGPVLPTVGTYVQAFGYHADSESPT